MNMDNHKIKAFLFGRINKLVLIFFVIISFNIVIYQQVRAKGLVFSTYLGGSGNDMPRDVCTDSSGNIYITGGTSSANFPTTPGAYDRTYNGGSSDVFVTKFDPNGNLIWSTLLGGPGHDRTYAIEVDSQGYVYIAGRAGPNFPTTSGVFQVDFNGSDNGIYGMQNGFVAKLSNDGSSLIWASYVGASQLCRDLAIDNNGYVYLPLGYPNAENQDPPSSWFSGAFQSSPQGGFDCGAIKVSDDGTQVAWATYLGGSGDDYQAACIRVDSGGYVYVLIPTTSNDIPTTAGVHDRTHNGGVDYYVAKLETDGSDLVWATFLGGSGDEWNSTHNLALDTQGNVYTSAATDSSNYPTTSGAYQESKSTGYDIAVTKLSPIGTLVSSTFIGGNGHDSPDGIYVDSSGNIFNSGMSTSTNFPVTASEAFFTGAYQSNNGGGGKNDAIILLLSADFTRLLYSTYIGGSSDDWGRSGFLDQYGKMYLVGISFGSGWPTLNAYQNSFAGGEFDGILAKFDIMPPLPPTGLRIVRQ